MATVAFGTCSVSAAVFTPGTQLGTLATVTGLTVKPPAAYVVAEDNTSCTYEFEWL